MQEQLQKAIQLFKAYQFEESRELLEQVIAKEPQNIEALLYLGKIHSKTQSYGDALNLFNRIIELEPNNKEAEIGIKLIQNILQLTNNYYYENAYTDEGLYEFDD